MTKAEKRVSFAKEVLKQFELGNFISMRQVYCDAFNGTCDVCALGALAVACCGPRDYMNSKQVVDCLKPNFVASQIELIESAFEITDGSFVRTNNDEVCISKPSQRVLAANKYKSTNSRKERLKKIMRNIIRNKGMFVV